MPLSSRLNGLVPSSKSKPSPPNYDVAGPDQLQLHQFQPFPDDGHEWIRLLVLEPSTSRGAHLVCTLFNVVHGILSYEPLSYTWGSEANQLPLVVRFKATIYSKENHEINSPNEPTKVNITRNLHTALLHLRHAKARRILWVDAVCINQGDNNEKGKQIRMMGRIYASGTRTIIWLGLANKDTKRLFSSLRLMRHWKSWSKVAMKLQESLARTGVTVRLWLSLCELLNYPWFHRVWTAQEICLSKKARVVCGIYSIDWNQLLSYGTSECLPDHIKEIADSKHLSFPPRGRFVTNYTIQRVIVQNWPIKRGPDYIRQLPMTLMLLASLEGVQAKDPKDKVFGMLALAEELGVSFPPLEYTMSIEQIYSIATRSWIRYRSELSHLVFAASHHPHSDLPSWAIDWDHLPQGTAVGDTWEKFHGYQNESSLLATLGSNMQEVAVGEGTSTQEWRKLRLRGFMLDQTVSRHVKSGNLEFDPYYEGFEIVMRWLQLISDSQDRDTVRDFLVLIAYLQTRKGYTPPPVNLDLSNFLTRMAAISRNFVKDDQTLSLKNLAAFLIEDQVKEFFQQKGAQQFFKSLYYCATHPNHRHHTVFSTSTGMFGFCYCDYMKTGDRLALLAGSNYIMILRKSGSEEEYQLVGPAHVVGLMDGAAWTENRDNLRDITLV